MEPTGDHVKITYCKLIRLYIVICIAFNFPLIFLYNILFFYFSLCHLHNEEPEQPRHQIFRSIAEPKELQNRNCQLSSNIIFPW